MLKVIPATVRPSNPVCQQTDKPYAIVVDDFVTNCNPCWRILSIIRKFNVNSELHTVASNSIIQLHLATLKGVERETNQRRRCGPLDFCSWNFLPSEGWLDDHRFYVDPVGCFIQSDRKPEGGGSFSFNTSEAYLSKHIVFYSSAWDQQKLKPIHRAKAIERASLHWDFHRVPTLQSMGPFSSNIA